MWAVYQIVFNYQKEARPVCLENEKTPSPRDALELAELSYYPTIRKKIVGRLSQAQSVNVVLSDVDGTLIRFRYNDQEAQMVQPEPEFLELIKKIEETETVLVMITGRAMYPDSSYKGTSVYERYLGRRLSGFDAIVVSGGNAAYTESCTGELAQDPFFEKYVLDRQRAANLGSAMELVRRRLLQDDSIALVSLKAWEMMQEIDPTLFPEPKSFNLQSKHLLKPLEQIGYICLDFLVGARSSCEAVCQAAQIAERVQLLFPTLEVVWCAMKDQQERIEAKFKSSSFKPYPFHLDLTAVSKGAAGFYYVNLVKTAVARLVGQASDCPEIRVVGCGDDTNDLPLLCCSDLFVASSQASPGLLHYLREGDKKRPAFIVGDPDQHPARGLICALDMLAASDP